jgi:hypothetical protein
VSRDPLANDLIVAGDGCLLRVRAVMPKHGNHRGEQQEPHETP